MNENKTKDFKSKDFWGLLTWPNEDDRMNLTEICEHDQKFVVVNIQTSKIFRFRSYSTTTFGHLHSVMLISLRFFNLIYWPRDCKSVGVLIYQILYSLILKCVFHIFAYYLQWSFNHPTSPPSPVKFYQRFVRMFWSLS